MEKQYQTKYPSDVSDEEWGNQWRFMPSDLLPWTAVYHLADLVHLKPAYFAFQR